MECAILEHFPLDSHLAESEYRPQLEKWLESFRQNFKEFPQEPIVQRNLLPSFAQSIRLLANVKSFYLFKWSKNAENSSNCLDDSFEHQEEQQNLALFSSISLPNSSLDNYWYCLWIEEEIKSSAIAFVKTAIHLSSTRINKSKILLNKTILFYGPPGTGKTTFSKALAQQISKQFYLEFGEISLLEINGASIYSKYYSESGKVVQRMFTEFLKQANSQKKRLFFVLLDEVESIAAARERSIGCGEPTDSIRAVNSLLNQLDKLVSCDNIFVLATSNILSCIDGAFQDRMDLVFCIRNPSQVHLYGILRESLEELIAAGFVVPGIAPILPVGCIASELLVEDNENSKRILQVAKRLHLEKVSGRKARKFCLLL